ncbi:prenyltransferase [Streptomyces sp. NPDC052013]|uniref:prenyltransferase n=1 Tax=Streptomyces sp. NPDC052013 TaxID=3365679 RepID=UPI0037CD42E7
MELIVPALVSELNRHLEGIRDDPVVGLDSWSGCQGFKVPHGMNGALLAAIRYRLRSDRPVPPKLLHALEVCGEDARQAAGVRPERTGTVGCSPAATAAWLHADQADAAQPRSVRYLERVSENYIGPMPVATPITEFERAWVLALLAEAGMEAQVPSDFLQMMSAAVGKEGVAGGAGLPPDADTTGATLYTLARYNIRLPVDSLAGYAGPSCFCTYPGERTASPTTNAHVLEALAVQGPTTDRTGWAGRARNRVATWLREQQSPEGFWTDKWHASPYYATACCALALDRCDSQASDSAVKSAIDWVINTQRADGSWGRWHGTVEETAHAVRILLGTRSQTAGIAAMAAALRGCVFLKDTQDLTDHPPLWHDKDLYLPLAIVQASRLAALSLMGSRAYGTDQA